MKAILILGSMIGVGGVIAAIRQKQPFRSLSQLGIGLTSLDARGERAERKCAGEDPIEGFPGIGDFERWNS